MRYNGEFRYRWLDRFLSGNLALSHTTPAGLTKPATRWGIQQTSRDIPQLPPTSTTAPAHKIKTQTTANTTYHSHTTPPQTTPNRK